MSVFVYYRDSALFPFYFHGHDLLCKPPGLDCLFCFHLAIVGKKVLFFTRNIVFCDNILCRNAHMGNVLVRIAGGGSVSFVIGVDHPEITHPHAFIPNVCRQIIVCPGQRFRASCGNKIPVFNELQFLCGVDRRLQTRTADTVYRIAC
ncbi:hypothetical protein SDC9_78528 [bioreactor metagenome]|uniref:Uncharacterized protein n=1 Tax=bioreactor metagenome TaxID=1076179 RepID=A0A644YVU8_9ZZZZ